MAIWELVSASGLLYRRNRYYDPHTGQFTQTDPIGLAGWAEFSRRTGITLLELLIGLVREAELQASIRRIEAEVDRQVACGQEIETTSAGVAGLELEGADGDDQKRRRGHQSDGTAVEIGPAADNPVAIGPAGDFDESGLAGALDFDQVVPVLHPA